MQWTSVRLELGSTPSFPKGSAARAYIAHLPLSDGGTIDTSAIQLAPAEAVIRRFWPNEPDLVGFVSNTEQGLTFYCHVASEDEDRVFTLFARRIGRGEVLTIRDPDGSELPFRVAEMLPLASALRPEGQLLSRA